MLDDTLVIWGGEFGRTPTVELPTPGANAGKINGRDHNHYGFTMWLAGGGVKGGHVHGATDEFGFKAVENQVHVHDLHATILHLLGLRPREAHLPLRRPRLPPDRRAREGGEGIDCISGIEHRNWSIAAQIPWHDPQELFSFNVLTINVETIMSFGRSLMR